ncbi:ferrochelatase [Helicobacter sp. MIT 21-1697]|uniref:ferrochelatase n=1 Tax=Helicobacter sp. MIT 21-1697 TaxID=2993733 RepID=UPI00224B9D4E|nr:ferrochelatase [Helicobacter sp. MIT 21-1697]MCX2717761.1 ferrochelatase [Helicobacter sp. MIT 21-1697]
MKSQAVVLLNMGSPNSLFEVESFLKNMFNDPLILGIKNAFMRKMLASFITHNRVEEAKKNYQAIGGKSPLITHTLNLTNKLNELDCKRFYTYAMRYTPPFAYQVLEDIKRQGIESVVLFSLYPQFSYSTIHSSLIDAKAALQKLSFMPALYEISSYHAHPDYIGCIIERIKASLGTDNPNEFVLLLSAHSLPQSRVDGGDPYQQQCEQNKEALQKALESEGITFKKIALCYQSKVGRMKWIGPSTKDTIAKYKKHKMIIFPLSFTLDNSETEYELKILYASLAKELNVPQYRVCSCFNDSERFAKSIINILEEHLHSLK